jgi:hypothetical protein
MEEDTDPGGGLREPLNTVIGCARVGLIPRLPVNL